MKRLNKIKIKKCIRITVYYRELTRNIRSLVYKYSVHPIHYSAIYFSNTEIV